MNHIHIVPSGTSATNALKDYAHVLAEYQKNILKHSTSVVGIDSHSSDGLQGDSQLSGLEVPSAIILHYEGYAYARRGCPLWLVSKLEKYLTKTRRELITIFHEVFATGPPWRSSFWLSPLQRWAAGRFLDMSHAAITCMPLYAKRLSSQKIFRKDKVHILPVFSTVGEPSHIPLWKDREPQMIVFGGIGSRKRIYERSMENLRNCCLKLGIAEVIDIGPKIPGGTPRDNHIIIREEGVLDEEEVSAKMMRARAGFFDYPLAFLSKSTVFAAYCAHGLLPVGVKNRLNEVDRDSEPKMGKHYLLDPDQFPDGPAIAENAHDWYLQHAIARHAECIDSFLSIHTNALLG